MIVKWIIGQNQENLFRIYKHSDNGEFDYFGKDGKLYEASHYFALTKENCDTVMFNSVRYMISKFRETRKGRLNKSHSHFYEIVKK